MFTSNGLDSLIKQSKRKNNGRACLKCQHLKIKCDYQRPCQNCIKRGAQDSCNSNDERTACKKCHASKIKCDKQRPCSRCLKKGKPEDCVNQVHTISLDASAMTSPSPTEGLFIHSPHSPTVPSEGSGPTGTPTESPDRWAETAPSGRTGMSRKRPLDDLDTEQDGEDDEDSDASRRNRLRVARPVSAKKQLLLTDIGRAQLMSRISNKIMLRMWECGYSFPALSEMFQSLPLGIQEVMDTALKALGTLAWIRSQQRSSQTPPPKDTSAPEMVSELIVNEVYDRLGCGYWCLTYDDQGRRKSLEVNAVLGKMMLMHPEELLARAGHSDVNIPSNQLEFFCTILDDLANAGEKRLVRYASITRQQNGRLVDAILVRRETLKEYDELGRIMRTQHFLTQVSGEEYDAAVRCDPSMCRPFASIMGDWRCAQEILHDATRDFLFDGRIASLTQTAEGSRNLRRLEACLRVRFEPIVQLADSAQAKFIAASGLTPPGPRDLAPHQPHFHLPPSLSPTNPAC
mmetsp:Transcript_10389/g.20793  ORF Transcript_10389/g.20793 Transcript_10389/m.20793 type:complete len:516 (+) Transcript_10389:182-1729(+)